MKHAKKILASSLVLILLQIVGAGCVGYVGGGGGGPWVHDLSLIHIDVYKRQR